jgi:hypothetical protein
MRAYSTRRPVLAPSGFVTLPGIMGVYAELRGFVLTHRECGVLRGATKPIERGFRLAVICPCGARFLRSVHAEDPEAERLQEALAAFQE